MGEINTELPCGCIVSEHDWGEDPPLDIEPCGRHKKGYLYFDGKTYDAEF